MSTKENLMESLVSLINQHFDMTVTLGKDNLPVVTAAGLKDGKSAVTFINGMIQAVEQSEELEGKLNYYFGNELDFDTREEYHRY